MTCSYETREVTGAGDWSAHNPEVMARARWAGQGGAHCCWSLFMYWASSALGHLRSSESVFIKCGPGVGG
jgi:hypothetical protein